MIQEISPEDLKEKMDRKEDFVLLDVREPEERQVAKIEGSKHIPMREIPAKMGELPKNKGIICYCHHGGRSSTAADFLEKQGFKTASLKGGIEEWSNRVDKHVKRYIYHEGELMPVD